MAQTKTREGHAHGTTVPADVKKRKSEKAARKRGHEAPEHAHWDFPPVYPHHPGEHGFPLDLDHPEDIDIESICGAIDDSQPVEQYDGTLGVTVAFVMAHQAPVGQLQWNSNLASIYDNPGNVSGVRWCSGTLISPNLFLTAGHCFDQSGGGWQRPLVNGTNNVIPPEEIGTNMHVNFDYQVDPNGVLKQEQSFAVDELVEYRLGGIDFAIARLAGSPGSTYGWTQISSTDAVSGDMLCLIQHPQGLPKRIEAGPLFHLHDTRVGYDSIDTLGGSSGSGILRSPDGRIVGVHTNGGCDPQAIGHNHGQRISSIRAVSPTVQALTKAKFVDIPKGNLKRLLDGVGVKPVFRDIGPLKRFNDVKLAGLDVRPIDRWGWTRAGRTALRPGVLGRAAAPFVLATPHHAAPWAATGGLPTEDVEAAYVEELARLEQAIVDRSTELQALEEEYASLQAEYEAIAGDGLQPA